MLNRFSVAHALTLALASPLSAWTFSPDPVCTLSHDTAELGITLTYDPSLPEYALVLSLKNGEWAASDKFGLSFAGAYSNTLGTTRQTISGPDLRVADRGFGNVLDGLQFADTATAFTDTLVVPIDLAGIAKPIAAFRRCPVTLPATS